MADSENVEVLKGEAVDPATVDLAKLGPSMVGEPPAAEVEGQAWVWRWVCCPNGHIIRILYDTNSYHYYTCCVCGCVFRC
jgi:hypothetical protein